MISVVVVAGGTSEERAVSLRSGAAVTSALQAKGYTVSQVDLADGLETISDVLTACDVVFPALHGLGGEDGVFQQQLEKLGVAYVGSDSKTSALCFDKQRYTALLRAESIQVPDSELVNLQEFESSKLRQAAFVLKPNDGGSSIDTFIVHPPETIDANTIETVFKRHDRMLLQELIKGTEITLAVVGDEPLPVIEIIPPAGQTFDYTNKYNGATRELCPPEHVAENVQQETQALALKIHTLVGCRDMSRTDMIIDGSGVAYVLETNTIPGLTDQSLLPKAAAVAGYDMSTLVDRLVKLALGRRPTTNAETVVA